MANILNRQGVAFRIIDKKGGPVEESRALVVHAKTLELLNRLGLAGRAVEEGQRMGAVALFSEGKPAGKISFLDDGADDRTPYPFALLLEQDKTEQLLIDGLEEAGGRVEWGTKLLSLTSTPDGVRATVRRPDGSTEPIEAGWAVGADGASSPVRHSLGLVSSGGTTPVVALPPFYQDHANWLPLRYAIDGLRSLLFYDGSLDAANLEGGWRDSLWFLGESGSIDCAMSGND